MVIRRSIRWTLAPTLILFGLSPFALAGPPEKPDQSKVNPAASTPGRPEIKPLPLTPIPDDPPPHEGAMIELPYIVEPSDLIVVEVLEALPGRPITGERLVGPDGKISLGFYGDIHVSGLTTDQIKVKVIEHLRGFLPDEVLGLEQTPVDSVLDEIKRPPLPEDSPSAPVPTDAKKTVKPSSHPKPGGISGRKRRVRPMTPSAEKKLLAGRPNPSAPTRLVAHEQSSPEEPTAKAQIPAAGDFTITIEIRRGSAPGSVQEAPTPDPEMPADSPSPPSARRAEKVAAVKSNRVFVDMSAYNSKVYYVQGDVAAPGKLPWTGRETVLDALNYAGGLITTADPKNIRLVRPARGGKPTKRYPVDLEAIRDKGETRANYQLFPGDRLVVGRDETVQKTIDIDRLAAPLHTAFNTMLQYSYAVRGLIQAMSTPTPGAPAPTPEQRDQIMKDWVDFWWKAASKTGGVELDEKTFREGLLRHLNPPPAPAEANEKKK
jgi:protein involved in polysaccharide export with SLBB domain